MEQEEVEKRLREIVVDKLRCEYDEITNESRPREFGADSLDEIEMLIEIEKEFNIYISDQEAERIITFGDAVEVVTRKVEAV